jgi:hypothetical protein
MLQRLIGEGWLRDVDSADRKLVGEAIARVLKSLRDPSR